MPSRKRKYFQQTLVGGEIDEGLVARSDMPKFPQSCATMENFIPKVQGGAENRPGFKAIASIYSSEVATRLIPFTYNEEQTYALLFTPNKMYPTYGGDFIYEAPITVTGITNANPGVVTTSVAHNFSAGEIVRFRNVVDGMETIEERTFYVRNPSGSTFELGDLHNNLVDTTNTTLFPAVGGSFDADVERLYYMTSPWGSDDLGFDGFRYQQTGDVLSVVLQLGREVEITRYADDDWSYQNVTYIPSVSAPTNVASVATSTNQEWEASDSTSSSFVGLNGGHGSIVGMAAANPLTVDIQFDGNSPGLRQGNIMYFDGIPGMTEANSYDGQPHPYGMAIHEISSLGGDRFRYTMYDPINGGPVDASAFSAFNPSTLSISSITSANPAVITFTAPHGLNEGQPIVVSGLTWGTPPSDDGNGFWYFKPTSDTAGNFYKEPEFATVWDTTGGVTPGGFTDAVSVEEGVNFGKRQFRYKVTAVTFDGLESLPSAISQATASDPLDGDRPVHVSWTPSTSPSVKKYRVYKEEGRLFGYIGESEEGSNKFTDKNFDPDVGIQPPDDPPRDPFSDNIVGVNLTIDDLTIADPCEVTTFEDHGLASGTEVQILGATLAATPNDDPNAMRAYVSPHGSDPKKFTLYKDSGLTDTLDTTGSGGYTDDTGVVQLGQIRLYMEKNTSIVRGNRLKVYDMVGITGMNDTVQDVVSTNNLGNEVTLNYDSLDDGAWTSGGYVADHPGAIGFFNERKVLSGQRNNVLDVHFSSTGDRNDFQDTGLSDAFSVSVSAEEINGIKHIVTGKRIFAMTPASIYTIDSGNAVFNGDNIDIDEENVNGCGDVRPIKVDDVILYVEALRSAVRELAYSFDKDGYGTRNLSILAEHMLEQSGIVYTAFSKYPNPVLWCVLANGELISMTYERENDVWGWARHPISGRCKNITSIREGNADVVYAVFAHDLTGGTILTLEQLDTREFEYLDDAVFLDSSKTYSTLNAPITNIETDEFHAKIKATNSLSVNDDIRISRVVQSGDYDTIVNGYWRVMWRDTDTVKLCERTESVKQGLTQTTVSSGYPYPVPLITVDPHGFDAADNNVVYFEDVLEALGDPHDQINNIWFRIEIVDATSFVLLDLEGDYIDATSWDSHLLGSGTYQYSTGVESADVGTYVEDGILYTTDDTFGKLWHLEGETVSLLGDGNEETGLVVTNGEVTSASKYGRVHVGIPYTSRIKTLPLETPNSQFAGKFRSINQVVLKLKDTRQVRLGLSESTISEFAIREDSEGWNQATSLFSGDGKYEPTVHTDKAGQVIVEVTAPVPCTIQGIGMEFEVGE